MTTPWSVLSRPLRGLQDAQLETVLLAGFGLRPDAWESTLDRDLHAARAGHFMP